MDRYAAFLRGMNLGRRRITNEALRAHVAELGFEDVATFRASGNVIFGAPGDELLGTVGRRLEEGLGKALRYDVPVFARTAEQVRGMAAFAPFDAKLVTASKGKLQVSLLTRRPTAAASRRALALATDEDLLAIEGAELYWLPSGGTIESALDLKALAKLLGPATMRTKGTIEQIAERYFSD